MDATRNEDRWYAAGHGNVRSRSWDIGLSLDELVEWEALEQFMSDMPASEFNALHERGTSAAMQPDATARYPSGRNAHSVSCMSACGSGDAGPMNCRQVGTLGSAPGGWPFMTANGVEVGLGGQAVSCGIPGGAMPNAATLAQSLYAGWQQGPATMPLQLQALPMERGVSWGAELLPFMSDEATTGFVDPSILDSPTRADNSLSCGALDGVCGSGTPVEDGSGRSMQKQRFVWTGELHRRFEAAVNTLGIDAAKPQAISQLMNCEGEGAPTRQNIKSHLQKYRLLMQKRSRQGACNGGGGTPSAEDAHESSLVSTPGQAADSERRGDMQTELEQHIANQEMNLKRQMELQTKLHRHMLVQRQLQHQLEHCFLAPGDTEYVDRQRYQATLSLKNSLRERLTKHVMLQQEMLQHLDALVGNEASKPAPIDGGRAEGRSPTDNVAPCQDAHKDANSTD